MFGFGKAPVGLSQGDNPTKVKHSIVMTGTCSNSRCRASLSVPHTFEAPWGWMGQIKDTVTCHCGTTSGVEAWSG